MYSTETRIFYKFLIRPRLQHQSAGAEAMEGAALGRMDKESYSIPDDKSIRNRHKDKQNPLDQ